MAEAASAPLHKAPLTNSMFLANLLRSKDIAFAFGVVLIILAMVVPLPAIFLNMLLTLNIALALVILLVSIYNKEALQFSTFPSLLLITTLFRLSLNVSSTRLILSGQGAKIDIVKAFGNFVVGGNYVLGMVVFLIIVLIQFIVITKGAERVAEVSARFALDAMPMKSMAIDAEMNAGAIDQEEATRRRMKVQRESDFYGAMDGASKFVKNDAIAGIIITVINLLGGIILGVFQRGESAADALATYALFTVGDGLSTQIPALLIAAATGIVVTRANSDASMGEEVSAQLLSNNNVLGIGAGLLLVLGMIPGLPTFSFLSLGLLLGWLSYLAKQNENKALALEAESQKTKEAEASKGPEDVSSLLTVDPLELEIGYNLVPLVDVAQGGDLLDRITILRRQIAVSLGLVVPPIRIRDNIQLSPSTYVFKINGLKFAEYEVLPDHFLAMDSGSASGEIDGIQVIEPAFNLQAVWVDKTKRDRAEMAGYTVVDPTTVIVTHITEVIKKNAHEILGRQELQKLLDNVKETNQTLLDAVVPNIVSHSVLLEILRGLLKEGVSVRYMTSILDALDHCAGITDTDALLTVVRQKLARQIYEPLLDNEGVLKVISLNPKLEQALGSVLQKIDGVIQLALDPNTAQKLLEAMKTQIEEVMHEGINPVIVCNAALRMPLKRLTEGMAPRLTILSYQEIPPEPNTVAAGMISIN